jgi:hypothetical protein
MQNQGCLTEGPSRLFQGSSVSVMSHWPSSVMSSGSQGFSMESGAPGHSGRRGPALQASFLHLIALCWITHNHCFEISFPAAFGSEIAARYLLPSPRLDPCCHLAVLYLTMSSCHEQDESPRIYLFVLHAAAAWFFCVVCRSFLNSCRSTCRNPQVCLWTHCCTRERKMYSIMVRVPFCSWEAPLRCIFAACHYGFECDECSTLCAIHLVTSQVLNNSCSGLEYCYCVRFCPLVNVRVPRYIVDYSLLTAAQS